LSNSNLSRQTGFGDAPPLSRGRSFRTQTEGTHEGNDHAGPVADDYPAERALVSRFRSRSVCAWPMQVSMFLQITAGRSPNRFSPAFSISNAFRRFASETSMPPDLPGIECRLRPPTCPLAAKLCRLCPCFLFAQDRNDLLFRELRSLHCSVLQNGRTLASDGRMIRGHSKTSVLGTELENNVSTIGSVG